KDFDDYLNWRVTQEKTLQKEFVTDTAGNVIVDYIGKFEQLETDFADVCTKIGLEVTLPQYNKTRSRKSYTDYYCDRTRQL
ncbi:hypothetical protein, partial [Haemophilus parainfluenzae]|uniref:hypothetical protein n=1 Tax=Haemophilus parainfluenzae TaxID=729 RepID=UPI001CEC02A5